MLCKVFRVRISIQLYLIITFLSLSPGRPFYNVISLNIQSSLTVIFYTLYLSKTLKTYISLEQPPSLRLTLSFSPCLQPEVIKSDSLTIPQR